LVENPLSTVIYTNVLVSSGPNLLNPPETIRAVICYLRRGDEFLLLLKAKGKFGADFWNAPGGKIQPQETAEEAVVREVKEETGLFVESFEKLGYLEFYFGEGKSRPDWTAEVFVSNKFSGEERESVEGKLKWFSKDGFPYGQMWEDDRYWIPLMVEGIRFRGRFEFTSDAKKMLSHKIEQHGP
jgi:8-oxo-dGTP diphosphatase